MSLLHIFRKSRRKRAALRRALRAGLTFAEIGAAAGSTGPCSHREGRRRRPCERAAVCRACRKCRVHCGCWRRIEVERHRPGPAA